MSHVLVRVVAAAVLVTTGVLVVVFTRLGPVIWSLSSSHGVHLFDLVTLPLGALALLLVWPLLRRGVPEDSLT